MLFVNRLSADSYMPNTSLLLQENCAVEISRMVRRTYKFAFVIVLAAKRWYNINFIIKFNIMDLLGLFYLYMFTLLIPITLKILVIETVRSGFSMYIVKYLPNRNQTTFIEKKIIMA